MDYLLYFVLIVPLFFKLYKAHDILVYLDHSQQGTKVEISIDECNNLPEEMEHQLTSINTRGKCAHFYAGKNCTGASIEVLPNSPSHHNLHHWGFNDRVVSVGPCRDNCDIGVTGAIPEEPFDVEIYGRPMFKGIYYNVRVEGCALVPTHLVFSTLSVKDNGRCIQLYNNVRCSVDGDGDKTIELRQGTPFHDDIPMWNFPISKAISHCRHKCDNPNLSVKKYSVSPQTDEIILFDEKHFEGNWLVIKLNNTKCLSIDVKWEGRAASVKVREGTCVLLYDKPDCKGEQLYVGTFVQSDLSYRRFDEVARSMRICPGGTSTESPPNRPGSKGVPSSTAEPYRTTKSDHVSLSPVILSVVIIVPILGIIISVFLVLLIMRRCHPYKNVMEMLSEKEIQEFLSGLGMEIDNNRRNSGNDYSVELLAQNRPYNQACEIPRSLIKYDAKVPLGMGEYGVVYKGTVMLERDENVPGSNNFTTIPVAIKTVKPNSGAQHLRSLLKEVKVMLYVGKHPYIAHMVGCCTSNLRKGEILVLVEYCPNGSLESFLQKNRKAFKNIVRKGKIDSTRPIQTSCSSNSGYTNVDDLDAHKPLDIFMLLQWCLEIAKGMEFLASAKVIHSDLAARNVLLSDHLSAKIADFGLSRQLYCYSQYVKRNQEPLPWRWLAIESLKSLEFSSMSDVWSYGVLCWEIFTLAEKPYPGMVWSDSFVSNLEEGLRLGKPKYTLTECYNLLIRCWDEEPMRRPTFTEIIEDLQEILITNNSTSNTSCEYPLIDLANIDYNTDVV